MTDPITVEIAAAIAGKATESLTEAGRRALAALTRRVREKLASRPDGRAALDTLAAEQPDDAAVAGLAAQIETAAHEDPAFGEELHRTWNQLRFGDGNTVNVVHGNVGGSVVNARDIHGDINIG